MSMIHLLILAVQLLAFDALLPTFEVGGRQYPDTAILRNALPGPAFRAPGLSIPRGLGATACRSGSRSMVYPAVTIDCCVSAWPSRRYLSRCTADLLQ
jgi:hypothetical protein